MRIYTFFTAEKLYGIKPNSIGDMRNAVVPYAISLFGYCTDYKLNLEKIWRNQKVSDELSAVLYSLMKQLNEFILNNSPSKHYIEWAKKEDCWTTIKQHDWNIDTDSIKADFATDEQLKLRQSTTDILDEDAVQKEYEISLLRSIPYALWEKIEQWGRDSGFLNTNQQSFAGFDMSNAVKLDREITDAKRAKAMRIYETVCEHNIELLEEADELSENEQTVEIVNTQGNSDNNISLELIQKMVDWDKRRHILKDWQWNLMNDIAYGKKSLNDRLAWGCKKNLEVLKKHGFTED